MGKLVSISTRKRLGEQNYKANDKLASKGIYIGCLPKVDAESIREFQNTLIAKQQKIDELIDDFEDSYTQYLEDVTDVLMYFGCDITQFKPTVESLMVGEDGNVWLVEKEEEINK